MFRFECLYAQWHIPEKKKCETIWLVTHNSFEYIFAMKFTEKMAERTPIFSCYMKKKGTMFLLQTRWKIIPFGVTGLDSCSSSGESKDWKIWGISPPNSQSRCLKWHSFSTDAPLFTFLPFYYTIWFAMNVTDCMELTSPLPIRQSNVKPLLMCNHTY